MLIVNCGDPGTPGNGSRVLATDTFEGSTVSYTCDSGFRPNTTLMTRECVLSPDGVPEWTDSLPECLCKWYTVDKLTIMKYTYHIGSG